MNKTNKKLFIFVICMIIIGLIFSGFMIKLKIDKDLAVKIKDNQFVVMSTTDMHGKIWDKDLVTDEEQPNNYLSAASAIDSILGANRKSCYLFDNGDSYQGTDMATYPFKESVFNKYHYVSPVAIAMQFMKYDGYTLGNHEFNYSWDIMKNTYDYLKCSGVDCVCANIYDKTTGKRIFQPYQLRKVQVGNDEIKIANIALENTDVPKWDSESNYPNMIFHAPENENADLSYEVNKVKQEMARDNVQYDFLIVSAHTGAFAEGAKYDSNKDYFSQFEYKLKEPLKYLENTEDQAYRIVRNTEGVDMFIFGHDHVDFYSNSQFKNKNNEDVLVVNGAGTSLTETVFNVEKINGKYSIKLDSSKNINLADYSSYSNIKNVIETYSHDSIDFMSKHLTKLDGNFDQGKNLTVDDYILHQTDAMDLILRGMCWAGTKCIKEEYRDINTLNKKVVSTNRPPTDDIKCDFAIANPGSITKNPKDGDFYVRNLFELYRFPNKLNVVPLTGQEIKNILEYNATSRLTNNGYTGDKYSYSIIYGLNFTYDLTKPEGSRVIIQNCSDGNDFKLDKTYLVATNNYLIGNTANAEFGKISSNDCIFKDLTDGGLIVDFLRDYMTEMNNKYGVVYNTDNCEKNGEQVSHWEIKK